MPLQDAKREYLFHGSICVDELLHELDPANRQSLASIEKHITILPENIVFASGDEPLKIYVHRGGRAVLFHDSGPKSTVYACPIGPNQIYGLVEALSGSTFKFSLKTVQSGEFDVIDRDKLLSFIQNQPALRFRLAEILNRLYQQAMQTIKSI